MDAASTDNVFENNEFHTLPEKAVFDCILPIYFMIVHNVGQVAQLV